jgi:hypothetical protein
MRESLYNEDFFNTKLLQHYHYYIAAIEAAVALKAGICEGAIPEAMEKILTMP